MMGCFVQYSHVGLHTCIDNGSELHQSLWLDSFPGLRFIRLLIITMQPLTPISAESPNAYSTNKCEVGTLLSSATTVLCYLNYFKPNFSHHRRFIILKGTDKPYTLRENPNLDSIW